MGAKTTLAFPPSSSSPQPRKRQRFPSEKVFPTIPAAHAGLSLLLLSWHCHLWHGIEVRVFPAGSALSCSLPPHKL